MSNVLYRFYELGRSLVSTLLAKNHHSLIATKGCERYMKISLKNNSVSLLSAHIVYKCYLQSLN